MLRDGMPIDAFWQTSAPPEACGCTGRALRPIAGDSRSVKSALLPVMLQNARIYHGIEWLGWNSLIRMSRIRSDGLSKRRFG